MIESIRDFFLDSPIISKLTKINVDYLGVDPIEYTIDSAVGDPLIKEYVDGGKLKQYVFNFGSREYYGPDVLQNLDNSKFYDTFTEWVEEQVKNRNLPELPGNREVMSMEVLSNGYLFAADETHARYQIQLRIIYYEGE